MLSSTVTMLPPDQFNMNPADSTNGTLAGSDGNHTQAKGALQPAYNHNIGESTTATQLQQLTPVNQTRLVLIPSPTSSTPNTIQLTNFILFTTLLQKTTMTKTQALMYAFAWSTCLLHHRPVSATETSCKTPLDNHRPGQHGQSPSQQHSLNIPEQYLDLLVPPFPYNLWIHTPRWLQITLFCIAIIIIFARPALSLLLYIQWCAHAVTLEAPRRTPRLALDPVIRKVLARQHAQTSALQLKVEKLEATIKDIKCLQVIHTRAMHRSEQWIVSFAARFQHITEILDSIEILHRLKVDQPNLQ